jgi:exodeoxyribonuclease VII small subunit
MTMTERDDRADAGLVPVGALSYTEASAELDEIVAFFEQREVDVDQLVARLERATAIVDELDRRLRQTRTQVEELVPRLRAAGTERLTSVEGPREEMHDDPLEVDAMDYEDQPGSGDADEIGTSSAGRSDDRTPGLF